MADQPSAIAPRRDVVFQAAAAAVFLPTFAAAIGVLLAMGMAVRRWLSDPGHRTLRWRGLGAEAAFAAWLALTMLWTPAPIALGAAHWLHYVVPVVGAAVIAAALPGSVATRSLQAFAVAAIGFALLQMLHRLLPVPVDSTWRSMAHYVGNKSIANHMLLALACTLALEWALQPRQKPLARAGWLGGSGFAAAVVIATSASRSALLTLALLMLAWGLARLRRAWHWLLLLALVGATVLTIATSRGGLTERAEANLLQLSTSQRVTLYRETWAMILQRPWFGHGVGSWQQLWRERNADPAMKSFSTAHSELLQVPQQAGIVGALLLVGVVWRWGRLAGRQIGHSSGRVAMLVMLTCAVAGALHAGLRDHAFALPMALLAGLALAACRPEPLPPPGDGGAPH